MTSNETRPHLSSLSSLYYKSLRQCVFGSGEETLLSQNRKASQVKTLNSDLQNRSTLQTRILSRIRQWGLAGLQLPFSIATSAPRLHLPLLLLLLLVIHTFHKSHCCANNSFMFCRNAVGHYPPSHLITECSAWPLLRKPSKIGIR